MRYTAERSEVEKVGITVWGRRISPVFDAARTLLIAELAGNACVDFCRFPLEPGNTEEVVRLLHVYGTRVLICGAISNDPASKIENSGIHLFPFISGKADQVLEWYARGGSITGYMMPGCCGQGRGNRRCREGTAFRSSLPAKKKTR